jgi:hypothetical protein
MKLPEKVFILGHEYKVKEMDNLLFREREAYGDCCNEKRLIRVYCGVSPALARDTLLHEIFHAFWFLLNIATDEEEEKVVSKLATVLIGFFDDPRNKEAKKYLIK